MAKGRFIRHSAKEPAMYTKLRQMFSLVVLAAAACAGTAQAQTPAAAPEAKPDYTITGNFGIYSQYVFRGLTQTDRKPAAQGGFDYANTNGVYLGTWASNISWLHDAGVCNHGCSLEWDIYGGWKYAINDDWGTDIGVLYYYYPGSYVSGATKPDTTEVYGAISWKWVSLKYSYSVDHTFGVPDTAGYIDLSANYPLNDAWTLNAHVGRQDYQGSTNGVSNDVFDYTDWKLGVTWTVNGYNIGAYYTDTNAKDAGYTLAGRNIGKATGTVFLQKTF
jgi:uncharacterized protein (TIGR02001 family)